MSQQRVLTQQAVADLADIPATSRWFRSGGLRLHVLDYAYRAADDAINAKTPLLILPGITMPAVGMDFVARELTDEWRVLVLDVRGRGLSDSATSFTLIDYAQDVEALIDSFQLSGTIVLGHSMGARIAAVVAQRARVEIAGTVIVDPPMSGPGRGEYPTRLDVFMQQLAQAYRGTTEAEVAVSWPRWSAREQQLRARWLGTCDSAAVSATHAGFESEDFFDTWPDVLSPSVLIRGSASAVVVEADFALAQQANSAARYATVEGAGHMVFWDEPGLAITVLRNELRRGFPSVLPRP